MKVFRFKNWRTGLYYDEDDDEFNSSIGVVYEDEKEAKHDFDVIARDRHADGISFYDFYSDHEIVVSALDDIGTVDIGKRRG